MGKMKGAWGKSGISREIRLECGLSGSLWGRGAEGPSPGVWMGGGRELGERGVSKAGVGASGKIPRQSGKNWELF